MTGGHQYHKCKLSHFKHIVLIQYEAVYHIDKFPCKILQKFVILKNIVTKLYLQFKQFSSRQSLKLCHPKDDYYIFFG